MLAVHKPAGVNTHRADAHAQDGMHEWVQRQRPTMSLSILHRLDKGTSGLLVFGKTLVANRSLSEQFEQRSVAKRYELLTGRDDTRPHALRCDRPIQGSAATTDFELEASGPRLQRYTARPHTGRTHQVRVHATELALAITGDPDHGGESAARLFLHAASLGLEHPTGGRLDLTSPRPPSFDHAIDSADRADLLDSRTAATVAHEARAVLFDPRVTDAYLWIDRDHDGFPDVRVERLGDVALAVRYQEDADGVPDAWLDAWDDTLQLRAIYQQHRPRRGAAPVTLARGVADARFEVRELGVRYLIDLEASATSTGLFLDQRETRRELRNADLSGRTLLNAFAHTGALSLAAALAGAETLSLDLSKRYLEWAAENFRLNHVDPADHDFVYGDALDWMDRLAKRSRTFDLVLVDPPSASTSRGPRAKRWSVDRDLSTLIASAARLCAPGGTIYASTNLRRMTWPHFLDHVERGLSEAGRAGVVSTRTVSIDHRTGAGDPAYLKAAWIALDGNDA